MSPRFLILTASVTVNVALGVVWWQRSGANAQRSDTVGNPPTPAVVAGSEAPKPAVPPTESGEVFVHDETDEGFVARLQREGFPPRIIRELVRVRLREKYADQLRALAQDQAATPYWHSRSASSEINLEGRAKLRALNQEISNEIKRLLGPDIFQLPGDPVHANRERMYGPLPSDKIAGIEAINADYSELSNRVREGGRGILFPEDREMLHYLERERQADLARLLTPEELSHSERRSSPTAASLRGQLRHFAPTEEEYLAMFDAQRAFDERYGRTHLSGEQEDRRGDARPELFAAMEAALGAERFEDYRLMTDGNYGGTMSMVTGAGLPETRAKDLVRIQQEAKQRADALRLEPGLTLDQRNRQLAALREEAGKKVTALLGTENVSAYERGPGQWLRQLVPTTP